MTVYDSIQKSPSQSRIVSDLTIGYTHFIDFVIQTKLFVNNKQQSATLEPATRIW